jgi:hypothetical protein
MLEKNNRLETGGYVMKRSYRRQEGMFPLSLVPRLLSKRFNVPTLREVNNES